jgi:hypothetical protein
MVANFIKALRGEEERVVKPEETLNVIRTIGTGCVGATL